MSPRQGPITPEEARRLFERHGAILSGQSSFPRAGTPTATWRRPGSWSIPRPRWRWPGRSPPGIPRWMWWLLRPWEPSPWGSRWLWRPVPVACSPSARQDGCAFAAASSWPPATGRWSWRMSSRPERPPARSSSSSARPEPIDWASPRSSIVRRDRRGSPSGPCCAWKRRHGTPANARCVGPAPDSSRQDLDTCRLPAPGRTPRMKPNLQLEVEIVGFPDRLLRLPVLEPHAYNPPRSPGGSRTRIARRRHHAPTHPDG